MDTEKAVQPQQGLREDRQKMIDAELAKPSIATREEIIIFYPSAV